MEEASKEPLIESVIGEDEHQQEEYSEWKLLLACFIKTSVNPGYQNRDFRNSDGTPVIDPEVYRTLQNEVSTITTSSSQKHWALYFILVYAVRALPGVAEVSFLGMAVPRSVVVNSLKWILYHVGSHYLISKKSDSELLALVASHEANFWKSYGVTMGYSQCTKRVRWWDDDSGITLRRPRTSSLPVVERSAINEVEGSFPPIYIHLDIPGNVHIDETNHDDSMKVDAHTWALLQSTHKELIQRSAVIRAMFYILPPVIIAYCLVSEWLLCQGCNPWLLLVGLAMFPLFFLFMILKENNHDQRRYQEVLQRVNTALHKDETRTDLTLEFHDEENGRYEDRRYQLVRRVLDPTREKE